MSYRVELDEVDVSFLCNFLKLEYQNVEVLNKCKKRMTEDQMRSLGILVERLDSLNEKIRLAVR